MLTKETTYTLSARKCDLLRWMLDADGPSRILWTLAEWREMRELCEAGLVEAVSIQKHALTGEGRRIASALPPPPSATREDAK